MKIGESKILDFYSEICCDYCWEVIHNHFDCSVCNGNQAATDMYHDISYMSTEDNEFSCEDCGACFEFVGEPKTHDAEIVFMGKPKNI